MRKTYAILCAVVALFLATTHAQAQPHGITPLVTAKQRATWDRERAEGHAYYKRACEEGAKDTTTAERYGSRGRWSALCYQMGGALDTAMARRAFEVNRRISKEWTPGSLGTSNELREHAVEHALSLTWVASALTADEVAAWRGWLVSNADAAMAATLRLNDTDQTTGTLMFWAVMDRAFGTDYLQRDKGKAAREAVAGFLARGKVGGGYPVLGDYEWGDLYLAYAGAAISGIEFPELADHKAQTARLVIHWSTPDLRDTFEVGDDQSPNSVTPHGREDLLAVIGHTHPEVRSFEMELRKTINWPDGTPFYARYIMWADPYAEARDWRAFAGTEWHNPGIGRYYYRTGWAPTDCGLMAYFPPLSTGISAHDHIYNWFGHFRVRCGAKWMPDSPIGYTANVQLANHTVLAGLPAAGEIGLFTGARQVGRVVYMSGTNAGLNVNSGYYSPPATYRHELSPTLIYIPAWQAVAKIERIHVDDPKLQTVTPTSTTLSLTRFSAALQTAINGSPLIRSFWHSQATPMTVANGVISGDVRVQPLYEADIAVVDMAPIIAAKPTAYGTLSPNEAKWFATVDPANQAPGFRVLTTLVGEMSGTLQQLDGVQKLRLSKPGERDIVVYTSTRPGPVLTTTRSGSSSVYDRTKADGILAARQVAVDDWADATADVFVEQPTGLVQLDPPPVPTPVPTPAQEFFRQLRELIDKYAPVVK